MTCIFETFSQMSFFVMYWWKTWLWSFRWQFLLPARGFWNIPVWFLMLSSWIYSDEFHESFYLRKRLVAEVSFKQNSIPRMYFHWTALYFCLLHTYQCSEMLEDVNMAGFCLNSFLFLNRSVFLHHMGQWHFFFHFEWVGDVLVFLFFFFFFFSFISQLVWLFLVVLCYCRFDEMSVIHSHQLFLLACI